MMNTMKNTLQLASISLVLFLGTTLSGCSSEPSEQDIQAAITKEQQATPEIMEGLVPEITSVKKIGCKPDSSNAYICDVELEAKQFGAVTKGVSPVRFVKTDNGWAMTK
ncbi:MAG: hypothetical protein ACRYGO_06985 [Janthinobacterium lividum]